MNKLIDAKLIELKSLKYLLTYLMISQVSSDLNRAGSPVISKLLNLFSPPPQHIILCVRMCYSFQNALQVSSNID